MSTTELTMKHATDVYGEHWTLSGPRGAVTFQRGLIVGMEEHSRTQRHAGQKPSDTCRYVDFPAYCDGGSAAGRRLERRYEASGDTAVIRAELESWYADLPEVRS